MNDKKTVNFLSSLQTAKYFGVHPNTVRKWDSNGTIKSYRINGSLRGHRRYDLTSFTGKIEGISNDNKLQTSSVIVTQQSSNNPRGAIYCRVSSSHQKPDLERQIECLHKIYPNYEIFKDVASGINFKRQGFLKLIERSIKGDFDEVVVAHKDRFSRFAFDFIKWLLQQYNVKLVVLNESNNKSSEQELAEDLLSIVHIFSCRQNGKRKYKNTSNTSTNSTTSKNSEKK